VTEYTEADVNKDQAPADQLETFLTEQRDAGRLAREKIQVRGSKAMRVILSMYLVASLLVFFTVLGAAALLYQEYQKPGVRVVDYRPCQFVDEAQHFTLTGKREFSYQQKNILGYEFRKAEAVNEVTQLDVNGEAMTVVGLTADAWWGVHIGTGEKGVQILKPAHTYIVTAGKKAVVVNYHQFCR